MILSAIICTIVAAASLTSATLTIDDINADLDPNLFPRHINAQPVGTSCADSEGAWYCMTSNFQRCASGQWSEAMDCAPGTVCEPEGLTYEFQSAFGIVPTTETVITTASTSTSLTLTSTTPCTSTTTETSEALSATETSATESTPCTTGSVTTTTTMATTTGTPKKEDTSDATRFGRGGFWWLLGTPCMGWSGAILLWVMI